jgi:GT2 family glycosyltransferase
MLVRTTVINEIGLLDESYFLYWEDTDWCARAAKHGYKVFFVPTSHVWHKVSATVAAHSEMQYYYNTRNGILFCRRHDVPSLPFFMMHAAADVFVGIFRGNGNMVIGFLRGISDFCRNIKGPREFK